MTAAGPANNAVDPDHNAPLKNDSRCGKSALNAGGRKWYINTQKAARNRMASIFNDLPGFADADRFKVIAIFSPFSFYYGCVDLISAGSQQK
jgi:hypothetical protein